MGVFHWREHYYGLFSRILTKSQIILNFKCLNYGFVSYKHAAFHFTRLDGLESY